MRATFARGFSLFFEPQNGSWVLHATTLVSDIRQKMFGMMM